jgi:NADPH:quinone reductase-like Zn-dependent oxidoreductase
MKAIVWTKYGSPDGLQLQEVEKPTPKDDEVLIRNHAATVIAGDCELRAMKFPLLIGLPMRAYVGFGRPKRVTILGQELAGVIEAVGPGVTRFKPGDQVLAPCLLRLGAYAEYVCLPENYPVLKPDFLTYEEAATVPTGGVYGLHLVRKAALGPGSRLLINGAGGSIGTYAVQIAKSLGAQVTAVDSAEKLDFMRSIGADDVIDYARQDFTESGESYDAIIDVVGKSPYSRSLRSLKPNGRYVLGNPGLSARLRAPLTSGRGGRQVITEDPGQRPEYYTALEALFEAGKIRTIIDRRYPLEQTTEAHRYVDEGHKKGNVVITVGPAAS